MSTPLPPQTLQARHHLHPRNTFAVVPSAGARCSCMMAHTLPSYGYFADGMFHYRDDNSVCEELSHHVLAQPPVVPNYGFRPILSATNPPQGSEYATSEAETEHALKIQVPSVLEQAVNVQHFSPVSDDDWARASIEYEGTSPASIQSSADSPMTPGSSNGSFSFTDHVVRDVSYADNTAMRSFFGREAGEAKPALPMLMPAMPQATPSQPLGFPQATEGYTYAGLPQIHQLPMPAAPYGYTSLHELADAYPRARQLTATSPQPTVSDTVTGRIPSEHGSTISHTSSSDAPSDGAVSDDYGAKRDRALLEGRAANWPYGRIKSYYNLRDADSTLRGRYRVLTKDKEERPRRPQWTAHDVSFRSSLPLGPLW